MRGDSSFLVIHFFCFPFEALYPLLRCWYWWCSVATAATAANEMKYSLIYEDVLYHLEHTPFVHTLDRGTSFRLSAAIIVWCGYFFASLFLWFFLFLIARIWTRFFINVFFAYVFLLFAFAFRFSFSSSSSSRRRSFRFELLVDRFFLKKIYMMCEWVCVCGVPRMGHSTIRHRALPHEPITKQHASSRAIICNE